MKSSSRKEYTWGPYSWGQWKTVLPNWHANGQTEGAFCKGCKQQVTAQGCSCGSNPPAYLRDLMRDYPRFKLISGA